MAEKDLVSKKIEDYNEVFADIYNTLLFRSPAIEPDRLKAGSTESIYKTDNGDLNSQSRDILKNTTMKPTWSSAPLGLKTSQPLTKICQ